MSEVETDIKPIEIETEVTTEVPDIDFSVTQLEGVGADD
jgi:hypothetical protein